MSKYGLFHNLPTAGRSDLTFLQACLFESLNIEQALQESSRRLYTLMAPARLTPEIHSVMEDTISAMDSLRKLQKTMNLMFLPNARWSVSTQFASQVNLGGMQMNSKEAKLWDSLVKESKEREEEDKKNKQSNNYSSFKGKGNGKSQSKKFYCNYCQGNNHTVDRCRIRIKEEREGKSKADRK